MYKVVETFSGIGSQVQALKNIKMEHDIVATVEWDINAICAYDILHNSEFVTCQYDHLSKNDLVNLLSKFSLSSDGKKTLTMKSLKHLSLYALKRILLAIERNRNLVSIMDVKGDDLPADIDILTYSFPCQDLSVCGFWHGNTSGIDRCAANRSSLLWQIERILFERVQSNSKLPRILLMENVSNILSPTHKENFKEWKEYLSSIGYYNHVYKLSALDFGVPQSRERVFMISVQANDYETQILDKYFIINNLENNDYLSSIVQSRSLDEFLRLDYKIKKYRNEAETSQPNYTPSREKIFNESKIISDGVKTLTKSVTTITTKQDRYPNSGLILHEKTNPQKSPYRNLTGRECILLMGFDEEQFDRLEDNNFHVNTSTKMFTNAKYIKMAGNSIVVQVLEKIFEQIMQIDDLLSRSKHGNTIENIEAS